MIFSKASRLPVLAGLLILLLMGFAGASYGSVRFDVVGAPTEVINTGRSEVLGGVTLFVRGTGNVTGTANGGAAQIALTYTNPALQIDNTPTSGIRIFFSSGFNKAFTKTSTSGDVGIIGALNIDLTSGGNRCVGQVTINMAAGATPAEGDFIRIEGVRGRIDASLGNTPGTDLYVDLQSINDPSANNFTPSTVRVAKSFPGMNITIANDSILLCFPTTGKPTFGTAIPNYSITIQEGFPRSFVSVASTTGAANDRVDSGGPFTVINGAPGTTTPQPLGAPSNDTQFIVYMEGIPASVASINWDAAVVNAVTKASLVLVTSAFDGTAGIATATYRFQADNQTGMSDTTLESFTLKPLVVLKGGNQTATGDIKAAVTLAPTVACASGCAAPSAVPARPRFLQIWQSKAYSSANIGCDANDPTKLYCSVIRCQCFLLFTYVTAEAGFNTGISVANTTGDTAVFGTILEAPDQLGTITFYFYNKDTQYRGFFQTDPTKPILPGQSYVTALSNMLATANMPDKVFTGYVIARAEFQFCHGFAFIADSAFANIAQGYLANVIPDPAIKAGKRTASDAGDITNLPAGEGLNN